MADLDADAPMQPLAPPIAVGALSAPLGLCVYASRYIVIADSGNRRIVVFDAVSTAWSSFDGGGLFSKPRAVAADGVGGLLIADTLRVFRVADHTGASVSELLPPLPGRVPLAVGARNGIEIDVATGDGFLLRTLDGGASWVSVPLGGPLAPKPAGMARASSGPTYVCDLANGRVLAVADDGLVSTVLDATLGAVLPTSIAVSGTGRDLYVVDTAANRLRRFALDHAGVEPAEFVNGRRADGTFRFDRVGGIAEGSFA